MSLGGALANEGIELGQSLFTFLHHFLRLYGIALFRPRLCNLSFSARRISDGRKAAFPETCMLDGYSSYRWVTVTAENKKKSVVKGNRPNPVTCKLSLTMSVDPSVRWRCFARVALYV